jgi:L-threonylcarbamoyladenylate synthase
MPIIPPERSDEAVRALLGGEVIAIPTDTVYGLAASLDHPAAVLRLAELKGRAADQPIAVLIDSAEAVTQQLDDPAALDRVRRHWPGALTAIVRTKPGFADAVTTEAQTVGLRVPDDDLARSVIRGCGGALAVTSANRHDESPATSAEGVAAIFGDELLILDGGPCDGGVASTVVDLTSDSPTVLREGAVTARELGLQEV